MQDWFIHSYILNDVGTSPLVSGFFWDDVWNPSCNIHDQVPHTCDDMGLTAADLKQLTLDYQKNMAALREATLAAGKYVALKFAALPQTLMHLRRSRPYSHSNPNAPPLPTTAREIAVSVSLARRRLG